MVEQVCFHPYSVHSVPAFPILSLRSELQTVQNTREWGGGGGGGWGCEERGVGGERKMEKGLKKGEKTKVYFHTVDCTSVSDIKSVSHLNGSHAVQKLERGVGVQGGGGGRREGGGGLGRGEKMAEGFKKEEGWCGGGGGGWGGAVLLPYRSKKER